MSSPAAAVRSASRKHSRDPVLLLGLFVYHLDTDDRTPLRTASAHEAEGDEAVMREDTQKEGDDFQPAAGASAHANVAATSASV